MTLKSNDLITCGNIPKNRVFYKYLRDTAELFYNAKKDKRK